MLCHHPLLNQLSCKQFANWHNPFHMHIEINKRLNMVCISADIWGMHPFKTKNMLNHSISFFPSTHVVFLSHSICHVILLSHLWSTCCSPSIAWPWEYKGFEIPSWDTKKGHFKFWGPIDDHSMKVKNVPLKPIIPSCEGPINDHWCWNVLMKWSHKAAETLCNYLEPLARIKWTACNPKRTVSKKNHFPKKRKQESLINCHKTLGQHVETSKPRYYLTIRATTALKEIVNQHLQSQVPFRSRRHHLSKLTAPKFNQLCSQKRTLQQKMNPKKELCSMGHQIPQSKLCSKSSIKFPMKQLPSLSLWSLSLGFSECSFRRKKWPTSSGIRSRHHRSQSTSECCPTSMASQGPHPVAKNPLWCPGMVQNVQGLKALHPQTLQPWLMLPSHPKKRKG